MSEGLMGVAVLGFFLYFVPAVIAFGRGHHNAGAIFALNLLLGWTVLGWIAAFIWSLTAVRGAAEDQHEPRKTHDHASD